MCAYVHVCALAHLYSIHSLVLYVIAIRLLPMLYAMLKPPDGNTFMFPCADIKLKRIEEKEKKSCRIFLHGSVHANEITDA